MSRRKLPGKLERFKREFMTQFASLLMKTTFSTYDVIQDPENGIVMGLDAYRVKLSGLGETVDLMDIVMRK